MRTSKNRTRILFVCQAGLIAAMYAALTLFVGAFGLANGAVQLRISEALCVLPFFTPAAIPGLTIGCLLANIATGVWQDMLFGTLATLLGALGARALRRIPWLVPLPTVLSNTVIIPWILCYAYGAPEGIPLLMLTVGIGEVLSAYVLGMLLYSVLKKSAGLIFKE